MHGKVRAARGKHTKEAKEAKAKNAETATSLGLLLLFSCLFPVNVGIYPTDIGTHVENVQTQET